MIFALMFLAAGAMAQDDLMVRATNRLSAAEPAPKRVIDYRLADRDATGSTAKDRALAEDGQRCSLVGARLCTKKPRTLLSAPLTSN